MERPVDSYHLTYYSCETNTHKCFISVCRYLSPTWYFVRVIRIDMQLWFPFRFQVSFAPISVLQADKWDAVSLSCDWVEKSKTTRKPRPIAPADLSITTSNTYSNRIEDSLEFYKNVSLDLPKCTRTIIDLATAAALCQLNIWTSSHFREKAYIERQ